MKLIALLSKKMNEYVVLWYIRHRQYISHLLSCNAAAEAIDKTSARFPKATKGINYVSYDFFAVLIY